MHEPHARTDALFEARDIVTFNRRFLRLPEIRGYLLAAAVLAVLAVWLAASPLDIVLPVAAVLVVYPFYEYALHRWLLHVLALCRTRWTAGMWWRMHYRHHAVPGDAGVIFAAPPMLAAAALAGAALVAAPFAAWGAFASAAAAAFAAGTLYEYFHALAHARMPLRGRYFARMRRHHMMHHHVADERNFGIVTDIVDRLAGTVVRGGGRSPTAYNLGYTSDVARVYPYVEEYDRVHGTASGEAGPDLDRRDGTTATT
jgi:sterol desaturase/sphingolipid hydroxylase (fatty acid hydroxylase superfamily)